MNQVMGVIALQIHHDDLIVARFSEMLPEEYMLIEATQAPLGLSAWPEFTRRTLGVLHYTNVGQLAYECNWALAGPFEAKGTRQKFAAYLEMGLMMRAATDPSWDEVETIGNALDDLSWANSTASRRAVRPTVTLELPKPASL